MKLAQFEYKGKHIAGLVHGEFIFPVSTVIPEAPDAWPEVIDYLHSHNQEKIEARLAVRHDGGIPLEKIALELPVAPLNKIICVGLNYRDHAAETGQELPKYPVFFIRYYSSFAAPGENIAMPEHSAKFDYESELTIVMGTTVRNASAEEGLAAVFGYTVAMDGSVRDYQKRTHQWTLGKNFDDSGSIGPWIVSANELPSGAKGLGVQARVNGELLQDGNTGDMIFSIGELVAALTECMTLHPGDVILTGTPAGVGFARNPPVYLKAGDEVEVSVEKIGTLRNKIMKQAL